MVDVYVSAGSNIEPEQHLVRALEALESTYGPLRVSPAYRNKPVGFTGADFINLVVGFSTDQPVEAVRKRLQEIEASCGRPPDAPKWEPRTMDLDILLYGEEVRTQPGLMLPRPDLIRRAYMLKPMADLAPGLVHPTERRTMRELWESFPDSGHELAEIALRRSDPRRSPGSDR
jgi:2-amino-4-hydroxy-6-hydroxymethyldihydropteridine diphosphokinase